MLVPDPTSKTLSMLSFLIKGKSSLNAKRTSVRTKSHLSSFSNG